ncbi:hypothetical protein ACKRZS_003014 [Fusarium odoratissimum]
MAVFVVQTCRFFIIVVDLYYLVDIGGILGGAEFLYVDVAPISFDLYDHVTEQFGGGILLEYNGEVLGLLLLYPCRTVLTSARPGHFVGLGQGPELPDQVRELFTQSK